MYVRLVGWCNTYSAVIYYFSTGNLKNRISLFRILLPRQCSLWRRRHINIRRLEPFMINRFCIQVWNQFPCPSHKWGAAGSSLDAVPRLDNSNIGFSSDLIHCSFDLHEIGLRNMRVDVIYEMKYRLVPPLWWRSCWRVELGNNLFSHPCNLETHKADKGLNL